MHSLSVLLEFDYQEAKASGKTHTCSYQHFEWQELLQEAKNPMLLVYESGLRLDLGGNPEHCHQQMKNLSDSHTIKTYHKHATTGLTLYILCSVLSWSTKYATHVITSYTSVNVL